MAVNLSSSCDWKSEFFCSPEAAQFQGSQCYDTFAQMIEELTMKTMGPRFSRHNRLLFVIYTVILCTGVIGSCTTCLVIAKQRYMHTRTNCYLFSLAISDLLLLLQGLTVDLHNSVRGSYPWPFGGLFCQWRTFLTEACAMASVMILTCFTVERYIVICNPRRIRWCCSRNSASIGPSCGSSRNQSGGHRMGTIITVNTQSVTKSCIGLIIGCWVVAMSATLPLTTMTGVYPYINLPKWNENDPLPSGCPSERPFWIEGRPVPMTVICSLKPDAALARYVLGPTILLIITCVFFVCPMIIMIVLYTLIGLHLREHDKILRHTGTNMCESLHASTGLAHPFGTASRRPGDKHQPKLRRNRKDVTKMLVCLVAAFFICWAPFHLQRLLTNTKQEHSSLYYVMPTLNVILYSLMSARFRRALRATFCLHPARRRGNFAAVRPPYQPQTKHNASPMS